MKKERTIYLSTNIKYLRKKSNKTQKELASTCGKRDTAISNWEKGIREPDAIDLANISTFFNVPIDDLILKDLRKEIK